MNKYIALDVETGGIGSDTSLLTAYLAILDENLNVVNDLYLRVKPNDGIYKVNGKAMEINGINLAEHDKVAITYKEAGTLLYEFLNKNRSIIQGVVHNQHGIHNVESAKQLIPLGHNVRTDVNRIIECLLNPDTWWQFVSYRSLDTAVIGGFLVDCGKLPTRLSAGLKNMAEHFGVGKQGDFGHDAKHDVELTVGVYRALLTIGML